MKTLILPIRDHERIRMRPVRPRRACGNWNRSRHDERTDTSLN